MRSTRLVTIGLFALTLLVVACSTTRQARSVKTHGFLGDYSQLVEGKGDQAQLVYLDKNARFSNCDAVMIDSVTLWKSKATSKISAKCKPSAGLGAARENKRVIEVREPPIMTSPPGISGS